MSVAGFIATQRAEHGVPHAVACRALGVSQAWFYKWCHGDASPAHARRQRLTVSVQQLFARHRGTYGSPRIAADLREEGWRVSVNTVAKVMAGQGLAARPRRRRRSTTRPGKGRWRAPDLVNRRFGAEKANQRWYGDGTEIVTEEGKLYLDTVLDMVARRVVGFAMSDHHDADLAVAALQMAVAVRGGGDVVAGVVMHTDQGAEFTSEKFRTACARLQITQSMGRPGSGLDNAVIESWHSTLEFEVRKLNHFETKAQARCAVATFIDEYNHDRRHSALGMLSPVAYEQQMSVVPPAEDGVVLTGIKAEPLRGGLRPALTPAPGATNQAAMGTTEQTEHGQIREEEVSTDP